MEFSKKNIEDINYFIKTIIKGDQELLFSSISIIPQWFFNQITIDDDGHYDLFPFHFVADSDLEQISNSLKIFDSHTKIPNISQKLIEILENDQPITSMTVILRRLYHSITISVIDNPIFQRCLDDITKRDECSLQLLIRAILLKSSMIKNKKPDPSIMNTVCPKVKIILTLLLIEFSSDRLYEDLISEDLIHKSEKAIKNMDDFRELGMFFISQLK